MHPTLSLDNLAHLSPSDRTVATSAAKGSLDALRDVVALISTDFPRPGLLAPVFFANLDPLEITSADRMQELMFAVDSPISRAIISLEALSARNMGGGGPVLANEASADVWPRAWKWLKILARYHDDLVHVNPLSDVDAYSIYCAIILRLRDHKETKDLIYAADGPRAVITRAWTIFLANRSGPEVHDLIVGACRFILEDTISPTNITEIMQGAGSTDADLAKLFVEHLKFAIPGPDYPASSETLLLLGGVIRLLKSINYRDKAWTSALLSQGIVTALVVVMLCLTVPTVAGTDEMLEDCFFILARILAFTPRHQYLVEALKAGLLHAIVLSRCTAVGVECFLSLVLPRSTVYYSVLRQLDNELGKVEDIAETSRFRASKIFERWTKFVDVAEARLELMRRYDAGQWLSGTDCANVDCDKLMSGAERKQCSGCGTSSYCSVECQKLDWKVGGHRTMCMRLRPFLLSDPEIVGTRDRSFMWALAHHDYLTNKANLYVTRISVMNKYPGKPLFSVLDYTNGAVSIGVRLFSALGPVAPSFQVIWDENVARAARSGGRIHLLVLLVPEGENVRYRLLTMRAKTSTIQDGMEEIAKSLPVGLEDLDNSPYRAELARKVTALLKQDGCDANVT
ncbi:hypothetical protein C8R44DRAFT_727205 [Mycena epipterygia]|nr:hypothetical protein C8R44DRAFT_727205 [Mycena epipterygia]